MDSRLREDDGVMKIQSFYESIIFKAGFFRRPLPGDKKSLFRSACRQHCWDQFPGIVR